MTMARSTAPLMWRDLDEDQREFYRGLDPEAAICRGKRRHLFRWLVPGRPLPRSVDITRPAGQYQVIHSCENGCGRTITVLCRPDGTPDYSTARYGGWTAGRQLATGLGLTAADDREWAEHIQGQAVEDGFKLAEARRERAAARRAAG